MPISTIDDEDGGDRERPKHGRERQNPVTKTFMDADIRAEIDRAVSRALADRGFYSPDRDDADELREDMRWLRRSRKSQEYRHEQVMGRLISGAIGLLFTVATAIGAAILGHWYHGQ